LVAGVVWVAACTTVPPQVAAPKGASLRSEEVSQQRADQLDGRSVNGQAAEAARPLEAGQAGRVIVPAEQDRILVMANAVAALAGTRQLIPPGLGVVAVLPGLNEGAELLFLSGRVAEDGHDWELAMNRYEALPADYPQRGSSLLRARFEWRSSNLPQCAQQAVASPRLTRSELAILLVSLAPQLVAVESGGSAVLSDIVDQPCYLDVLTAVRCNLLVVDRLENRFFPSRSARLAEVHSAVESLCRILDLKPPVWCQGAEATADCTLISVPVRGQQVAELVSRLTDVAEP
jgi:hypothetical protein